jgi:protein required for attachment to host cells
MRFPAIRHHREPLSGEVNIVEIEHDTWVVVADGEKFLLLRNDGDAKYINLQVVEEENSPNAPARELATDRAGRRFDSTRPGRNGVVASGKSGLEETDWHRVAETRFAEHLAELLNQWAGQKRFRKLVVIADPRTLGALRPAYGFDLEPLIQTEIAKDLTNLPLDQIEASISAFSDD